MFGMLGPDDEGGLDALGPVGGGHPDVGQNDVGLVLGHRGQQLAEVRGRGHQLHVLDLAEQGRGTLANQVVVLGEHDAQAHDLGSYRGHTGGRSGKRVTVRVVLSDDNVLVREGVRALLAMADDIEVVGVAEDAPTLLAAADEHLPDVVVTDIKMPPNFRLEGIDCAHEIRRATPGPASSCSLPTTTRHTPWPSSAAATAGSRTC